LPEQVRRVPAVVEAYFGGEQDAGPTEPQV